MKHAAFILSYGAPLAFAFIFFDVADVGFSLRSLGLLLPGLFLSVLAVVGLDAFGLHARYEKKTSLELVVRGAFAGIAFIGLCVAAKSLFSWKTTFYTALGLSMVLAPIALLLPPHHRTQEMKGPNQSATDQRP